MPTSKCLPWCVSPTHQPKHTIHPPVLCPLALKPLPPPPPNSPSAPPAVVLEPSEPKAHADGRGNADGPRRHGSGWPAGRPIGSARPQRLPLPAGARPRPPRRPGAPPAGSRRHSRPAPRRRTARRRRAAARARRRPGAAAHAAGLSPAVLRQACSAHPPPLSLVPLLPPSAPCLSPIPLPKARVPQAAPPPPHPQQAVRRHHQMLTPPPRPTRSGPPAPPAKAGPPPLPAPRPGAAASSETIRRGLYAAARRADASPVQSF
jgi:hypothetical protein